MYRVFLAQHNSTHHNTRYTSQLNTSQHTTHKSTQHITTHDTQVNSTHHNTRYAVQKRGTHQGEILFHICLRLLCVGGGGRGGERAGDRREGRIVLTVNEPNFKLKLKLTALTIGVR